MKEIIFIYGFYVLLLFIKTKVSIQCYAMLLHVEGVMNCFTLRLMYGENRYIFFKNSTVQLRPYTLESTGSRPISEVKLVMASSVLW